MNLRQLRHAFVLIKRQDLLYSPCVLAGLVRISDTSKNQ